MIQPDTAPAFLYYWRLLAEGVPEPVAEYKFATELGRRYRADWAWVPQRVLVEIDGGQWAARGGRHATDRDREKGNIAASMRWIIFHFSPLMLERDPAHCVAQVLRALEWHL